MKPVFNVVFFMAAFCCLSTKLYADTPLTNETKVNNTAEVTDSTRAIKGINLIGKLTQGSLITGKVEKGLSIFLNDTAVKLDPEGNFVIGFGRDADLQQVLTLKSQDLTLFRKEIMLSKREYKIQRVEGVPKKMVNPDPSKTARIQSDALLVRTARKNNLELDYFLQDFVRPLDAPITGVYGSQRFYNGTPKRPHFGLDYAAPVGTIIYAPASGVVTLNHDDMYYSGGTLIIDHGYGVSSTFLHLSELLVKKGDKIAQGDVIAKVGRGGRATGPHLDWRINWFDVRIDPQLVLERYQ